MDKQNFNWQLQAKGNFSQIKQGSPSSFWSSGLTRRLEKVKKYVDFEGKKILDMGCGTGLFLEQFKDLGAEGYGFDVDEKKIAIAKRNFPHVIVSPAEKLPWDNEYFDIIWSHEVLEHVDDDQKTVNEALRVLKRGGLFIIFCPNRLWPFETHGIYLNGKYYFGNIPFVTWFPGNLYKKLTPHVRNYTNRQLEVLFKDKGVKILHHSHVFPGFDQLAQKSKSVSSIVRSVLYMLESTPLHYFGLSHFMIVIKK